MQKLYILNNDAVYDVYLNMALDEVLFLDDSQRYFLRVYQFNENAITVGRCQQVKKNENLERQMICSHNATRRITGGGAVFHNAGLTFTFICDNNLLFELKNINESYRIIHSIIQRALLKENFKLDFHRENKVFFNGDKSCFNSPVNYDLMYADMKIVGGAQKRRANRLIHQGEISISGLNKISKDNKKK